MACSVLKRRRTGAVAQCCTLLRHTIRQQRIVEIAQQLTMAYLITCAYRELYACAHYNSFVGLTSEHQIKSHHIHVIL